MKTQALVVYVFGMLSTSANALPMDFGLSTADASFFYSAGTKETQKEQYDWRKARTSVAVLSDVGYNAVAQASATLDGGVNAVVATTLPGQASLYRSGVKDPTEGDAGASYTAFFMITGGTGSATATLDSSFQGTLYSGTRGYADFSLNISYASAKDCRSYYYDTDYCSDNTKVLVSERGSVGSDPHTTAIQSSIYKTAESSFTFQYGQAFALYTNLDVDAGNGGAASFNENLSAFKLAIPEGATLVSMSGQPFTDPVPEPESYAMLLVGLGLIARRRMG